MKKFMLHSGRCTPSVSRGFTLIEMLVSVAVFSVVMVMALGALLSLSAADRKAQSLKSAIDNLNFAIDSMSRTIRTGYNYHCGSIAGTDCPTGNNTFVFTSYGGATTYYKLESSVNDSLANAQTLCGQTTNPAGCIVRSNDGSTWSPITGPNVIINDLSASSPSSYLFYVRGSQAGSLDNAQPIVVLTLSGFAQVSATQQSTFHLQTTITQRIYDQ